MNEWHPSGSAFGKMQLLKKIAKATVAVITGNDTFLLKVGIINWRKRTRKTEDCNFTVWPNLYFNRFMEGVVLVEESVSKCIFNNFESGIRYFKRFSLTVGFDNFLSEYLF